MERWKRLYDRSWRNYISSCAANGRCRLRSWGKVVKYFKAYYLVGDRWGRILMYLRKWGWESMGGFSFNFHVLLLDYYFQLILSTYPNLGMYSNDKGKIKKGFLNLAYIIYFMIFFIIYNNFTFLKKKFSE